MVDVTDQEALEAWLQERTPEDRVAFAARNALRALPSIGFATDEAISDLTLATLRAILTSGVAGEGAPPDVRDASRSADFALRFATFSSALSADSAARSSLAAALGALSATDSAVSAALSIANPAANFAPNSAATKDLDLMVASSAPTEVFHRDL